jgi:hypothetical protein
MFRWMRALVFAARKIVIARQVKKNDQISEQLMREEAFASALYELFSH